MTTKQFKYLEVHTYFMYNGETYYKINSFSAIHFYNSNVVTIGEDEWVLI